MKFVTMGCAGFFAKDTVSGAKVYPAEYSRRYPKIGRLPISSTNSCTTKGERINRMDETCTTNVPQTECHVPRREKHVPRGAKVISKETALEVLASALTYCQGAGLAVKMEFSPTSFRLTIDGATVKETGGVFEVKPA